MKFKLYNRIKTKNYENFSNDYIWVAVCVLWDWKVRMQRMEFTEESMCEPSSGLQCCCIWNALERQSPHCYIQFENISNTTVDFSQHKALLKMITAFQEIPSTFHFSLEIWMCSTQMNFMCQGKIETMSYECDNFIITLKWWLSKAM